MSQGIRIKTQEAYRDKSQGIMATGTPLPNGKMALDVLSSGGSVSLVAADAVDSFDASRNEITAAAHAALAGDLIRFTSGALSGQNFSVFSTGTNTIQLIPEVPSSPAAASTFNILRSNPLLVSAGGGLAAAPVSFVRDGIDTQVTEDTVTPANNRPLPVKLSGFTGDVTITANQLNVRLSSADDSVAVLQATHDNLNLNANLQIADTDVGAANPVPVSDNGGSLTVDAVNLDIRDLTFAADKVDASGSMLGANSGVDIGDVTINNAAGASAVNIQDGGNSLTVDAVNLDIRDLTFAADKVDASGSTLGANSGVDVGDVTINNASGAAAVNIQDGGNSITVDSTDLASIVTNTAKLSVVDFLDTPLLDASSTNIPGSASTPLTVVASLAARTRKIQFLDTTGSFIGLYSDPAGTPVLQAIVGPGSDQTLEVDIAAATVLGVRSMTTTAITSGNLAINFMG